MDGFTCLHVAKQSRAEHGRAECHRSFWYREMEGEDCSVYVCVWWVTWESLVSCLRRWQTGGSEWANERCCIWWARRCWFDGMDIEKVKEGRKIRARMRVIIAEERGKKGNGWIGRMETSGWMSIVNSTMSMCRYLMSRRSRLKWFSFLVLDYVFYVASWLFTTSAKNYCHRVVIWNY